MYCLLGLQSRYPLITLGLLYFRNSTGGLGLEPLEVEFRNSPHKSPRARYNLRDQSPPPERRSNGRPWEGRRMHQTGPKHPTRWRGGFWSLIATQFQGAFNDNGLKFFVIYLILGQNPTEAQKDFGVFLIGNLFAIPFLLFSMTGGYLADRFSKRDVTIGTKVFEIAAMLFAIFAFWRGSPYLAFTVIFLASTQAAFFGPSKYGLLPELLPAEELSWGNGILELTTFIAIISGTVFGSYLAQTFRGRE